MLLDLLVARISVQCLKTGEILIVISKLLGKEIVA